MVSLSSVFSRCTVFMNTPGLRDIVVMRVLSDIYWKLVHKFSPFCLRHQSLSRLAWLFWGSVSGVCLNKHDSTYRNQQRYWWFHDWDVFSPNENVNILLTCHSVLLQSLVNLNWLSLVHDLNICHKCMYESDEYTAILINSIQLFEQFVHTVFFFFHYFYYFYIFVSWCVLNFCFDFFAT